MLRILLIAAAQAAAPPQAPPKVEPGPTIRVISPPPGVYYAPPAPPAPPPPPVGWTPPPRLLTRALFTEDDYPNEAMRLGQEGRVTTALIIGVEGRVRDCVILAGSGSAVLDSATCQLLRRRARFSPARAADGVPREAIVRQRIDWRLPREPFAPAYERSEVRFKAPGSNPGCDFASKPRSEAPDCWQMSRDMKANWTAVMGESTPANTRLVLEYRVATGGAQPKPLAALPAGARLLSERSAAMTIDRDGFRSECRITAQHGPALLPDPCRYRGILVFEPGEAGDRQAHWTLRLWERPDAAR